ncbi:zinc ribbon domain-containing protein [bacterium]|nr:zinc ribbon domain-containing protein [bacterium]
MPLFEYVCEDCRNEFEALVRSDREQVICPKCRGNQLAKRFSVPASAQVRGGSGSSAPSPLPTMGCGGPACQQGLCGGG